MATKTNKDATPQVTKNPMPNWITTLGSPSVRVKRLCMGGPFGSARPGRVWAVHLLKRQRQPGRAPNGDEATSLTDAGTDGSSLVLRDSRLTDIKGGSKLCL